MKKNITLTPIIYICVICICVCTIVGTSTTTYAQEKNLYPIVYSPDYNISFWGLEKIFHSFDGCKYGKAAHFLEKECNIGAFYKPDKPIQEKELLTVHTKEYLNTLNTPKTIARITEVIPLILLPNSIIQNKILSPMRSAVAGTLKALELAEENGYGINIGGGHHHAKKNKGGGFCVYADIQLAAKKHLDENKNNKVLIVDLDAHQGNGHETDLGKNDKVVIFDIYNKNCYPKDKKAKKYINYNYPIEAYWEDHKFKEKEEEDYLNLIKTNLKKAIKKTNPTLIIYNAGTDILEGDPIGDLNISAEGIIKRDNEVFKYAFDNKIPILMVTSGGYTSQSAQIIGSSIKNIITELVPKYKHLNKKTISANNTGIFYKIKPWLWSGLATGCINFMLHYKKTNSTKANLISSCIAGSVASLISKLSWQHDYTTTQDKTVCSINKKNFFSNITKSVAIGLTTLKMQKWALNKVTKKLFKPKKTLPLLNK